jgi:hypothetical protein
VRSKHKERKMGSEREIHQVPDGLIVLKPCTRYGRRDTKLPLEAKGAKTKARGEGAQYELSASAAGFRYGKEIQ